MKVIYCAGEEGRVVLDILQRSSVEDIVFVDDDRSLVKETVNGVEIIGTGEALDTLDHNRHECVVAYADQAGARLDLVDRVHDAGLDLFTVIDPDATVAESARIGPGSIVTGQSYVGPGAVLEEAVLLDSAVSISHDVQLAAGVTVCPNATIAGGTEVGQRSYIGAGATIVDHVSIGEATVVGAGAVVVDDVPDGAKVAGVPARQLTSSE